MKTLAAALLCSTTGCFVMTGTTTTTTKVGVENGASTPGKIDHVALAASANERTLTVRAVASRTCSRDVNNVYETRESDHLRWGGPDDPRAKVFGFFLAPVTIPISAAVSGLSVLGEDRVTRTTKVDHRETFACTTPASELPLALELPSGARELASSDALGELMYAIPFAEPYDGTIVVRSSDVSREVAYHESKPALVQAREAMAACGAGAATLALEVDATGTVTHAWVAGDSRDLGHCVLQRLARVRFPYHDTKIELPFGPERMVDTAQRITPVCAAIETDRDRLPEAERARAERAFVHVLEQANVLVVDGACEDTFRTWHEPAGNGFVVHVRNVAGARHTTVPSAAEVPAAYAQLIAALVELREEAHAKAKVEPAPRSRPAASAAR